jgi:hypothetical protein
MTHPMTERQQQYHSLKLRFQGIFNSFTAEDFADPVTSRSILLALANIHKELNNLARK